MTQKLLTTSEVAVELNMSRTAIFREIAAGRIKAERYAGWMLLVEPKELDRVRKTPWWIKRMRILGRNVPEQS